MGMMTEYYHYFFTTLVRNTEDLGMFFFFPLKKSQLESFHSPLWFVLQLLKEFPGDEY